MKTKSTSSILSTSSTSSTIRRRTFLGVTLAATGQLALGKIPEARASGPAMPNIVYVFADQWRAQAMSHAGDPNARTPNIDRLASESVNFTHAVSGCPVCSPYRASLMTGQYWLTHGIFLNDVPLSQEAVTIAKVLRGAGYGTGYIGKWHLDGRDRLGYIPRDRWQGFDFWKVLECTHEYNSSQYYDDDPAPKRWDGYDAIAQTREARQYIKQHGAQRPFALFLSWGPPHNPYETAPERYKQRVRTQDLVPRPNVPADCAEKARIDLAGYYAHCMALDDCVGQLMDTVEATGLADNTIFVFTSDHGDMLYSQGLQKKQKPYDESIRVPFLLRYPKALGKKGRKVDWLLNTPDMMPTLLGLCGIKPPETVEGHDFSTALMGGHPPDIEAALYECINPFGEWTRSNGGRECRGVRTHRYTYVRDLKGPWLLYDNQKDPYQRVNLCGLKEHLRLQNRLDEMLAKMLRERNDAFEPGDVYLKARGYELDSTETRLIRRGFNQS